MKSITFPASISAAAPVISTESLWSLRLGFKISTMQNPKPAAGNHSITNPTKSSPSASASPLHQRRRTPTTDAVNLNPITQNTAAAGSGAVKLTREGGSSTVVTIRAGSLVAKLGPVSSGGSLSVGGKEDQLKLKGSSGVTTKRKRDTSCPCPVCVPSKKQPDRLRRDDFVAGLVIDLNFNPKEGKEGKNKVDKPVAEKKPMEGAVETSDAAEKKSEGAKSSGAAAKGNAMKGGEESNAEGKAESPAEKKRGVEEKAEKEKREDSPSANKDGHKKAFAFDLNELPSHE